MIAPLTETVRVFGEEMPCSYEAMLLALAERLGLKGFGRDAFGPGQDLTRPDDFYLRMAANLATDGTPVPDADDEELQLFRESRRHLPRTVLDPARWERVAGPHWRKVVYVLNRGGRFQAYADAHKGELAGNPYGVAINLYQEKTALTSLGHGQWATGASDVGIDGELIKGDPARGAGVHANAAMWVDPYLGNTCFVDPVGGSVAFYDTRVAIVRA